MPLGWKTIQVGGETKTIIESYGGDKMASEIFCIRIGQISDQWVWLKRWCVMYGQNEELLLCSATNNSFRGLYLSQCRQIEPVLFRRYWEIARSLIRFGVLLPSLLTWCYALSGFCNRSSTSRMHKWPQPEKLQRWSQVCLLYCQRLLFLFHSSRSPGRSLWSQNNVK